MTEKTEEQIAKDRAAVEAMRNAKANMDTALGRIADLERALSEAALHIKRIKDYVPAAAYSYGGQKTLHNDMDEMILRLMKVRG